MIRNDYIIAIKKWSEQLVRYYSEPLPYLITIDQISQLNGLLRPELLKFQDSMLTNNGIAGTKQLEFFITEVYEVYTFTKPFLVKRYTDLFKEDFQTFEFIYHLEDTLIYCLEIYFDFCKGSQFDFFKTILKEISDSKYFTIFKNDKETKKQIIGKKLKATNILAERVKENSFLNISEESKKLSIEFFGSIKYSDSIRMRYQRMKNKK